jgi:hypothetical protein
MPGGMARAIEMSSPLLEQQAHRLHVEVLEAALGGLDTPR